MKIDNLIWSQVVVKDAETKEVVATLPHVVARFNAGDLLHLREYTSSQGTNTGRSLSYSYPELSSMSVEGITLKAFMWGQTTKDQAVIIELQF